MMASDAQRRLVFDDSSERTRVLDPTQSFIVQAPAGSGKTELLMQRYLTLLTHESVQQPENVLAITFTRKAAAEMRNRVLGTLQNAGQPAPPEAHKRLSWELAQRVAARDRELGWKVLENPERLEIRTVDSFCERIASRAPLLAGLGQSPAIAEDFEILYLEAAQRTLLMLGNASEEDRAAIARVLTDQDNRFDNLQKLLVEMLLRRDQWLRILGRSDLQTAEERARLRRELETSLQDAICSELKKIRETLARVISRDNLATLLALCHYAAGNVNATHPFAVLRNIQQLPGATIVDLDAWRGLREFCLNKDGDWKAQYDRRNGFPEKGPQKDGCLALIKGLRDSDFTEELCASLNRIQSLPPAYYNESQWESLLALFRVLPLAVANLQVVFAERGEVDHTEVALAAKAALGDEGHPTDLALHLGYKIQHLLVDEFQDTSVSQTELLERLIQAWSPETGSTLFVVGDPMQSIYGFRQAEVTLFQRARDHGFANGDWPLNAAHLSSNFRSRPELVAWFNEVFPQILRADDPVTGAVQYSPATAERGPSSASKVQRHSVPYKEFGAEAAKVVEIVQEELKTKAKSIAILVRSRRHVAHVAPALRDAKIPFRAKEIDLLSEQQTVRDLHAITKAMLNLADRTAWLTLLRGPWCGLSLADLWELCREGDEQTIWQLLQSRRDRLSPRGQTALERLLPVLTAAIASRGRTALRVLVESVWISLGGPAALGGTEREAKLRDATTYLALLQKLEAGGEVDEKRLDAEIERLHAQPDTAPNIRVEVMTIHGAKGLEFDVVILPGLNRQTDRNRVQLLNWRERVMGARRELLLAPMEPVGTKPEEIPIANYIRDLGRECSGEETKRLLYVAATRAQERLHLVTTLPQHDKNPETGSLFSLLPAEMVREFPTFPDEEEEETVKPRRPNLLRRLPENWTLPAAPAPLVFETRYPAPAEVEARKHTFVRVGEDLRRIGTVTHRFLQQIGDEGIEAWRDARILKVAPTIRALLVQEGIRSEGLVDAERRVRDALRKTLSDQKGRWILGKRTVSNNEFALSAVLDDSRQSIKVDRTFVEDGTRWLVDYKTSDQQGTITDGYLREQVEKYRDDLNRYAKILRAFDGLPVKGGLYFPLLQRWCPVEFTD